MEQILSIEEEQNFIKNFFYKNFKIFVKDDEFTEEKIISVAFPDWTRKQVVNLKENYHLSMQIDLFNGSPTFILTISHILWLRPETSNVSLFLLSPDGHKQIIDMGDCKKEDDNHVVVSRKISADSAKLFALEGCKTSLRIGDQESQTIIQARGKYPSSPIIPIKFIYEMAYLCGVDYAPHGGMTYDISDEKTDEIYDYCMEINQLLEQQEHKKNEDKLKADEESKQLAIIRERRRKEEEQRIYYERKKEIASKKLELFKLTLAGLEGGLDINPMEIDVLETIINNPYNIPKLAEMKSVCEEFDLKSEYIEWIDNIDKKYDLNAIKEDINRIRTTIKKRSRLISMFSSVSYNENTLTFIKDFANMFISSDNQKKYGIL